MKKRIYSQEGLKNSAKRGDAKAQFKLFKYYYNGLNVQKDKVEAFKWLRKAVESGLPSALSALDEIMSSGDEETKKMVEDRPGILAAAEQACERLREMSNMSFPSRPIVTRKFAYATKLWRARLGPEKNERWAPEVTDIIPEELKPMSSQAEEIHEVRKEAEFGNQIAQGQLAYRLEKGDGSPMDKAEVVKWCLASADQGLASAQYYLGLLHFKGDAVVQDKTEAAKWFRKAAIQGNACAQHNLAYMLLAGDGVPMDKVEAFEWFRAAALQGFSQSQHAYAGLLYYGDVVPQDKAEAAEWRRKSAEQGFSAA
jgi:TPR repeat protein